MFLILKWALIVLAFVFLYMLVAAFFEELDCSTNAHSSDYYLLWPLLIIFYLIDIGFNGARYFGRLLRKKIQNKRKEK